MRYHIHQGSFDFDWAFEDHSGNILLIQNPENNEVLNVNINRDRLEPGEDFENCIKRQLKLISRQIPGFAELARKSFTINCNGAVLNAIQMEARAKQEGYTIYQFQTAILLPNGSDMIIASIAFPGAITEAHRALWEKIISSFSLPNYND